ncbi:MAG: ferritin family protein [Candidatus Nanoarchaeia archaeon]
MEIHNAMKEALEFEERGKSIYEGAANNASNQLVKRTFEYLAKEEENHIAEIKNYLHNKTLQFSGDSKVDVQKFFKTTVSEFKKDLQVSEDELQLYEKAMELEKVSYVYYEQQRDQTSDEQLREFFSFLIEQEKAHYLLLEKTKEFLEKPEQFYAMEEEWNFEG